MEQNTELYVVISRLQDFCLAVNRYQCLLYLFFSSVQTTSTKAQHKNAQFIMIHLYLSIQKILTYQVRGSITVYLTYSFFVRCS